MHWLRELLMDAMAPLKGRKPVSAPDPPWLHELTPKQREWRAKQLRRGRNPDEFLARLRNSPQ
jgi:hypothetical protein